jgi:serine/threonine protein kinase
MIETGTLLQERYLIEKQIGEGGMGAVYLAVDQRFGSYVAIKETFYRDDELGEAFEREARLLNSLLHPVLPHVSDYFTETGGHFLVMQYIEGEDLFAILKREGAFPVKDVLRWMNSLLDALDYLHSQEPPIIHRDIKPHNLKITPRGDVILLDFGLAKLKSENTTGVKSVFGYSRKYSPLEQIQGTGTDGRSDLFALAATAYHLLTGKPPIDVLARASEIIVGNPDPLPLVSDLNNEVPVSMANVLNSALALNAAGRFISAKAMRHALENAFEGTSAEETQVLPEEVLPVIAAENGIVISPENEDFPALEAFAAGAAISPPVADNEQLIAAADNEELIANEPFVPPVYETLPVEPVFTQSAAAGDVVTRVSPRRKRSRLPLAALAALIIFAGLAAGYFINKANSSEINSTVQPNVDSNSNTGQSATILDSPTPEIVEPPLPENIEQAKTKPLPAEKNVVKKETVDEPVSKTETAEKPNSPPAQAETSRTAQAPRRTEAQRRSQPSPRVAEQQPVPDIESVFTGRPSWERNAKVRRQEDRRRQQREEMTEEEWREMRRQRREERRRRQNRNTFPF